MKAILAEVTIETPRSRGLCACGRRLTTTLDVCEPCMAGRRAECEGNRVNPNYHPRNPACSYGWHQLVIDCQVCIKDGTYGTVGCKPCEKCHFCNEVHPVVS